VIWGRVVMVKGKKKLKNRQKGLKREGGISKTAPPLEVALQPKKRSLEDEDAGASSNGNV